MKYRVRDPYEMYVPRTFLILPKLVKQCIKKETRKEKPIAHAHNRTSTPRKQNKKEQKSSDRPGSNLRKHRLGLQPQEVLLFGTVTLV